MDYLTGLSRRGWAILSATSENDILFSESVIKVQESEKLAIKTS